MQRILPFLLLLFLPVTALADGVVIPATAYPAKVTIPDQRALICWSNGTERLAIETQFSGEGTNFAWVVPLPSQPVIEEATTGLFPTLQYLFRPEIVHNVPRYYAGILALIGIGSLILFVRPTGRIKWTDILACLCVGVAAALHSDDETFHWVALLFVVAVLLFDVVLIRIARKSAFSVFVFTFLFSFCLCGLLAPAGLTAGVGATPAATAGTVSILDRKLVGIFETTTITSRDPKALENWLLENGFVVSTNAEPIIASYIKDGWVFVATKIRRAEGKPDTSTPHPLSFTFKTDKPVYPMRLTGLNSQSLSVDLYVFGNTSVAASHFKVENCTRPNIAHPLLHQWVGDSAIATKLTARLSPADMRNDVWLDQMPTFIEHRNRFFSPQGALTTALNRGMEIFGIGLVAAFVLALTSEKYKKRSPQLIGLLLVFSIVLGYLNYQSLPIIEVNLVKGRLLYSHAREEALVLRLALEDLDCHTTAEVRAAFEKIISNPTNADYYGLKNWNNYFASGQFREEDSPGNYILRETNNQLEFILIDNIGGEQIEHTFDLPLRHQP